jgi:hypothetical protein
MTETVERCVHCGNSRDNHHSIGHVFAVTDVCTSCFAGPGQGHDPDCNADRRPRVNGVLVCKCDYSKMLEAELATLREREQLETAVIEAVVAERRACEEVPELSLETSRIWPSAPWWEAHRKLEGAHAETEKALDALLAHRQRNNDGNG